MASSGLPSARTRASIARAATAYQRPQWNASPVAGRAGCNAATPEPAAISLRESSIASRRRPAWATAAYEPKGISGSGLTPGSTTRMSGGGRSDMRGLARRFHQAVQLAEVHQVVNAGEEEPLTAAQVPDQ